MKKLDTRNVYAARMLRVLNHIQRHLDEEQDLEQLAGLAHFSVSHFHRVFKGMLGETVMDHQRRIRLERAWSQLAKSGASITDIALDAGYDSPEAFSRSFRKAFGLSPTQCRARRGGNLFLPVPSGVHYGTGEIVEILLNAEGAAIMNVRITTLPERKIRMIRKTGPYEHSSRAAWSELCAWAGPKGLLGPGTLYVGMGHDDPSVTSPEKIRYDAAITVDRDVPADPPVQASLLPAGEYAVITHQGPYEKLEEAYRAIMGQWLPQSGREMRQDAPFFELYRNDPATTPPDQLLTDIHVPLK